jgi:hypothetical protein
VQNTTFSLGPLRELLITSKTLSGVFVSHWRSQRPYGQAEQNHSHRAGPGEREGRLLLGGPGSIVRLQALFFLSAEDSALNFWPELDRKIPNHLVTKTDRHPAQS